ncbi:MAG: membrane protein insertase YidC [Candidatus Eisenbacteria bacterium]|uniref:Membrane protein insertase YidC n=1 Tax=Eiseniibacteriota bacterium TaxID=2212470 RepID=A0A933WB97_UNCEI|nr:membrane protein insertase YidC [Candidatus Eisenbacteria bacterium]
MDRRTSLALVLALTIFVLFTAMQQKYAPKPKPRMKPGSAVATSPLTPGATTGADSGAAATAAPVAPSTTASGAPAPVAVAEQTSVIETDLYRATFTNRGARLLSFELKRYAAEHGRSNYAEFPSRRPKRGTEVPEGDRVTLGGEPTFGIDLGSGAAARSLENVTYEVAESTDAAGAIRALTYVTRDSSGFTFRQTWRVRPDSYLIDLEVETQNVPNAWRVADYSMTFRSWPLLTEANPANDLRSLRGVSLVGKDLHRDGAAGLVGKSAKQHDGVAHWAGVQSHYFMAVVATLAGDGRAAIVTGQNRTLTEAQLAHLPKGTKPEQPFASGTLVMPLPSSGSGVQRFMTYLGPADYFALAKEGGTVQLERAVDMGWNWIVPVSKLLLRLLKWVDSLVHNFGWTILILATLVRVALHPLNMSSMKSMRAMSRLQPEIERMREKYKNDPAALNTAMMALYKDNNVNPAGGCLPMIMQMPLFFAMYAVIFNAIDLRQAPFLGWIHDLSAPDKLFAIGGFDVRLLPVIMAATGFLSQLFTPTDPRQAPTMYMMNFVMLFIFYPMPSGLVIYWTVMNLLTALQQWLALRGDNTPVVVASVPSKGKKRS